MTAVEHCPRCSQIVAPVDVEPDARWLSIVCDSCRAVDRQPQGDTVRLFEPAPNQISGQLTF